MNSTRLRAVQGVALAISGMAALALLGWNLRLRAAPNDAPVAPVAPVPAATAPAAPPSPNVTIAITVVPPRAASVYWGKARLGIIKPRGALVVSRPRDSGPLDLIIRADGCLPVHTRAYTFNDNRISVRLTPLDQKSTLLGYREEVPPDAGAPSLLTPETTTLEPVP